MKVIDCNNVWEGHSLHLDVIFDKSCIIISDEEKEHFINYVKAYENPEKQIPIPYKNYCDDKIVHDCKIAKQTD